MNLTKRETRALSKVLRYYTKNYLGDDDDDLPYEIYDKIYAAQFWSDEEVTEQYDSTNSI